MSAYFQPWIIARLALSLVAALALLRGFWTGLRILRKWRVGRSSEGQLALERQAELVSTLVSVGLGASLGSLVLTLFGADRQADTIDGAMCAYGVFKSGGGFISLGLAFAAAFGCALWLLFQRMDLRYETPRFTRAKFLALYALTPLVLLDGALFLRFVSGLDLSAGGTCCSADLGAAGGEVAGVAAGPLGLSARHAFIGFLVLATLSALLLIISSRRRSLAFVGALSGLLTLVLGMSAAARYVAPHVYETPHHTCPFCLLHGTYAPFGWSLLAAFFSASVFGVGTAMATLLTQLDARAGGPTPARALGEAYARRGALLWTFAVLLALGPVLFYWTRTGTLLV